MKAPEFVLTLDEAHFHFNDYVNKENFRYWAPANPVKE